MGLGANLAMPKRAEAQVGWECFRCAWYQFNDGVCYVCWGCGEGTPHEPPPPYQICGEDCQQHSCNMCSVGTSCSVSMRVTPTSSILYAETEDTFSVDDGLGGSLVVKECAIARLEQEEWRARATDSELMLFGLQ